MANDPRVGVGNFFFDVELDRAARLIPSVPFVPNFLRFFVSMVLRLTLRKYSRAGSRHYTSWRNSGSVSRLQAAQTANIFQK